MTFLQPILLAALPLVALPVIIHLINQRRYQTVRWGAMMFLLAANRMSRGYARLRQWLILLFRTLAVAGLIFAVSRPLASGWLGLTAGGQPDTTIILLDRSPSMQQLDPGTVVSKLEVGRTQLATTLETLGSGRWVLIESTTATPVEIESPDSLRKLPATEPVATPADVPAMLDAAREYIRDNRTGRTDIWICSDIRENDWNAESSRWQSLRDSFLELPQAVRMHLLSYADVSPKNASVEVTDVRRFESVDGAELLVSLKIHRGEESSEDASIPVQFEIDGARSELTIKTSELVYELIDHRIPIERSKERGWGRVSIPADANPADNDFFFVFDRPQLRRTLIVSEDPQTSTPLQIAASIPPDSIVECSAETISTDQLATAEWDNISLVLWHAPLPEDDTAAELLRFVNRGGQLVFLPPQEPGSSSFLETRWASWYDGDAVAISTWRGDQGILANSLAGTALPLGELQVQRYCGLDGELTPLATLADDSPLIAHRPTDRGGVYFCSTTPANNDSSLAANGVVLYVLIQRALATGAASLGNTLQLVAGSSTGTAESNQPIDWKQIAGPQDAVSTEYGHHGGVYSVGEKLLAINRPKTEDHADVLADDRIEALFDGLDFNRVDGSTGTFEGLIQEVWRLFLASMLIALVMEAVLCMPRPVVPAGAEAQGRAS